MQLPDDYRRYKATYTLRFDGKLYCLTCDKEADWRDLAGDCRKCHDEYMAFERALLEDELGPDP